MVRLEQDYQKKWEVMHDVLTIFALQSHFGGLRLKCGTAYAPQRGSTVATFKLMQLVFRLELSKDISTGMHTRHICR